jgi:hypothetical protein
LTGIGIPRVDVVARKANLGFGDAVVQLQHNHAGHADGAIDGVNDVLTGLSGELGPAIEIEHSKLSVDGLRRAEIEKAESPPHIRDVDGLEAPVQDQDGRVDHDASVPAPHTVITLAIDVKEPPPPSSPLRKCAVLMRRVDRRSGREVLAALMDADANRAKLSRQRL